jgi:rhamnogalacturonyl hydrolase YesR
MKTSLLISAILSAFVLESYSQNIEKFLRPYADAIVEETAFEFTDKESGESFPATRNLEVKEQLSIEAEFLQWRYTSALVYNGLRELGEALDEEPYMDFGKEAFRFFFDNKAYYEEVKRQGYAIEGLENFVRFQGVWNDGAQMAALVEIYEEDPRADYLAYMHQVADYLYSYDEKDGAKKSSINIDQLYTKGVFMARFGRLTGERKYFDFAVKTVLETERMFYDPITGLYDQYYYPKLDVTNRIKWLRGIGWAAIGIVNILTELPEDHPGYDKVHRIFQKMVVGISSYQAKSGLWRHLVDRSDCYEETSGSTYIVYAIAKGINDGLLDPMYRDVAMAGWKGIMSMRDADGNIGNVTIAVSGSTSPSYYYNNSFDDAGAHFFGPLFLAGAEMLKLYEKYDGPKVRGWKLN